jgi:LysM repeat protein
MSLIRRGEMEAAREKLTEIIDIYRDSERNAAARDVLGEMNMDRLFSRVPMPGKLEYTVGRTRQDNLNAIAGKFRTTISYIKRVNNLLGNVIHPGDRLVLYPLDFEVEVRLGEKRLTVLKDGRFFKDYRLLGHHLPIPKLGKETTVAEVFGWVNEKKIPAHDERFTAAPKRLQTAGRGTRSGILFVPEPPPPPPDAQPSPSGIYLSADDMHELSTILRPGIPLRFL